MNPWPKPPQKSLIHELLTTSSDSQPSSSYSSQFTIIKPGWCETKGSCDMRWMRHQLPEIWNILISSHKFAAAWTFWMSKWKSDKFHPQKAKILNFLPTVWRLLKFFCSSSVLKSRCTWSHKNCFMKVQVREKRSGRVTPEETRLRCGVRDVPQRAGNSQNHGRAVSTPSGRTGNPAVVNKNPSHALKSEFSDAANVLAWI